MSISREENSIDRMPRTLPEGGVDSAEALRAAQHAQVRPAGGRRRRDYSWLIMTVYILFLMLPIYWLVNMSFKTNEEITGVFSLWPQNPTLHNYAVIFTDPAWYNGYINSIIYVVMNTVISVAVACPPLAFSEYGSCESICSLLLTNRWRRPPCSPGSPALFRLRPDRNAYAVAGIACSPSRWRVDSRSLMSGCPRRSRDGHIEDTFPPSWKNFLPSCSGWRRRLLCSVLMG